MTEHLGWQASTDARQRIFSNDANGACLVEVRGSNMAAQALSPNPPELQLDTFHRPAGGEVHVPELEKMLDRLGSVVRHRNPSLWNAVGTAIIRQVIRASQAKEMYQRFCSEQGPQFALDDMGTYYGFPTPEGVLELDSQTFKDMGMKLKERPLRQAAEAFSEQGDRWQQLPSEELLTTLQTVKGIGAWTARVAVADWSHDWSLYPHDDLAVRTWARRAAPSHDWPEEPEAFEQMWRSFGGQQVGEATLLTFAWGSQRGIIS